MTEPMRIFGNVIKMSSVEQIIEEAQRDGRNRSLSDLVEAMESIQEKLAKLNESDSFVDLTEIQQTLGSISYQFTELSDRLDQAEED